MQKNRRKKKPKYNMWQNAAYMISIAWRIKEKKVLVLSLLYAMISVAHNLVNLYVTPSILSAVEQKATLPELLFVILTFVGLMMLLSAAFSYVNCNAIHGKIQVRLYIMGIINNKALTTSYSNLGNEKFKELHGKASEATSGNDQATEAIWNSLTFLTTNVLGFLAYLLLLSTMQLWILLIIVITSLAGYFINKYINGYEYRHQEEVAKPRNEMWYINGRIRDYSTAKDIRLFGLKPWLEECSAKAMDAYTAFQKKANGVYFWGRIADLLLTFLRNGIAYAYLLHLVFYNEMSASTFLLYFSAIGGFAFWVGGILNDLTTLHRQSLDISMVRELIEFPEPFAFEDGEPLTPDKEAAYELQLVNVSYRYPESEAYILKNINLTLRSGEKLAVVGLNGAGKTTLIKLLCGFYDPTEGQVLLNGKDIRSYNRRDYYQLFSAVFQNFTLLANSIAVNVAQTEDNIDMDKVRTCAAQAGLLGKISSLPNGFETYLNREVYEDAIMLSGGETQRLMLARALYRDAPIIILDEPTAALDPIAEAELYQKYDEMTSGRSAVYISHRLASTRFCDRIILLENAHIVEEGSHDELLALGGRYAELFETQSKYYKEEVQENEERE